MNSRYYGICAWFTPGETLNEKMQFVQQVGLNGIELDFNHSNGEYALAQAATQQAALALKQQLGVDFPAIAINSLCEFGMSQPSHWPNVEYALHEGVQCAVNMGIPIVQLPSFFAGFIEDEAGFAHTVKAIQYACDLSNEVIIASENAMAGEQQLALVEAVNRNNFKLYFDCRNSWWMKAIPSVPILAQVLPHVCEVHLKDGIGQQDAFTALGEGDVGVADILALLKEANFNGRILLENDYNQFAREGKDPAACVQQDIRYIEAHLATP